MSEVPLVGVGVVLVENGRLLLIKRGNEPGKGLWAVPGGKVRIGETLKAAAQREAAEETGLNVDVGDVAWVGEHLTDTHHIVLIDFYAKATGGELAASDDAEEVEWVPLDAVDSYPLTPTMVDLIETLRR
ncbi:MAG: NUDIX hydrolase [Acidimicrobiia bacterium]